MSRRRKVVMVPLNPQTVRNYYQTVRWAAGLATFPGGIPKRAQEALRDFAAAIGAQAVGALLRRGVGKGA